ncbi:unnamed protein product [Periconia digitata]|uniref:Uncharacterized protein n=1 Tax=Periconia digitata TaxID=1303443 RepID=A0A9W4XEN7_9PLEO|nr:unnamed protein product [Periconia digitata]
MPDHHSNQALLNSMTGTARPKSKEQSLRTLAQIVFSLLFIIIASIVASVVVLVESHRASKRDWELRPAILLSIFSSAYSIALGGLLTVGVAVAWWRSIAEGTPLKQLHFIKESGSPKHFYYAFLAGRKARRVAIVALLILAIRVATGPFLQRSTTELPHTSNKGLPMKMDLLDQIPDGFRNSTWAFLDTEFVYDGQEFFFNYDITTTQDEPEYLCPENGTCTGHLIGPGVAWDIETTSKNLNVTDPTSDNETVFNIDMDLGPDASGTPVLYLSTTFVSNVSNDCIADLTTQTYKIITSSILYSLTIENRTVKPDFSNASRNPFFMRNYTSQANRIPLEDEDTHVPRGPLGIIYSVFKPIYRSQAVLVTSNNSTGRYDQLIGFFTDMYYNETKSHQHDNRCGSTWDPPGQDIIDRMLQFCFRVGFDLKEDKNGVTQTGTQNFTAIYEYPDQIFVTHFEWLAAAVTIMVVATIVGVALLWGSWRLGRYVTLSPLESGKALGAPLLVDRAGDVMDAEGIVRECGEVLVRLENGRLVLRSGVGDAETAGAGDGGREKGTGYSRVPV